MHPIPGVVEKKVAQGAWAYIRGWFNKKQELEKQVESLKAQLAEERSGNLAFEKLMSELVCRQDDDQMYWKKDGSGGPYCPVCLHDDKKRIPLTHYGEGSFYCVLHKHVFETEERRQRQQQAAQDRAEAGRRPSRFGPHSWMR